MNCKYDEYFIQKYNDSNLSVEEKLKFEKHLTSCQQCKKITLLDRAFISYVKQDESVENYTVNIMSQVDHSKYPQAKYKLLALLNKSMQYVKIAVPILVVSLFIFIVSSNSIIKETFMDSAINILNKGDRLNNEFQIDNNAMTALNESEHTSTQAIDQTTLNENYNTTTPTINEINIEKTYTNSTNLKGKPLVEKLNSDGPGVSPWLISYADNDKIFFRNYASLVGYKDGDIYLAADLISLRADHIQGSVVSEFKFNKLGNYVVIGNSSCEEDFANDFKSNVHIMNTQTGDYFIIDEANYANISDCWSLNGNYYAFVDKSNFSNPRLFDASKEKFYEISNLGVQIEKIFVTDEGIISFYADKKIYYLNEKTYEIDKKVVVDFEPLFIDGKNYTAFSFEDNGLKKYDFKNNNAHITEIFSTKNDYFLYKDYRFLIFRDFDSLKIFDFKEEVLNTFPTNDQHAYYSISPNGKTVLDTNSNTIYTFEGDNDLLEISKLDYSSNWISDSKIVFISILNQEEATSLLDIKAGEFEIITYDVISKEQNIIYNSLTSP
ncbi:UNVERIFIED_CONTAM: hypothetical protein Cloal_0478 [Acetivibrio alkalicellulosi]